MGVLARSGGVSAAEARGARGRRPPKGCDERTFEAWLAEVTERFDPLMAFLGVVFALLAVFDVADPGLSPDWRLTLSVATWAIWAVFLVDYLARLVAAPSTLRFVRRHWLAALMLLVPTLRVLRFGALARLGRALPTARVVSSSYRATGVARQLLTSRAAYLGGLASIAVLAAAQLAWVFERSGETFATFGDALLWAAGCVLALQGDPVPLTVGGRLVMLAAFAVGLVLVASLAGTVGAYLLEGRRERERADERE